MNELDFTMTLLEQDISEMSKHIYLNAGEKRLDQSMDKDLSADDKKVRAEKLVMSDTKHDVSDKIHHLITSGNEDRKQAGVLYKKGQRLIDYGNRK